MAPYKAITRRLSIIVLLAVLAAWAALPAAAQSTVPDLSQFGFPQVGGTVDFTPGQATSVSAGNQRVDIPADFLSVPAKFELLTGDPSSFHQFLSSDDQSKQLIAAFAFRVTNTSTGQLVGKFDKPVLYSITDASVTSDSEIYNTSPANPPAVTDNPAAPTISGTTLTHPFGGAGVGWLVASPAPVVVGMPTTGSGSASSLMLMAALLSALALGGGLFVRRWAKQRA